MRRFPALTLPGFLCLLMAACQPADVGGEDVPTARAAAEPCDRACLEGFVDRYMDAMIAHDPSQVPLAGDFRMTENGQRLPVGDALWKTMLGKGAYRLFVTDVDAGQVAFIGTIREQSGNNPEGTANSLALRLKVENQQISEAEALVVRGGNTAANLRRNGAAARGLYNGRPA